MASVRRASSPSASTSTTMDDETSPRGGPRPRPLARTPVSATMTRDDANANALRREEAKSRRQPAAEPRPRRTTTTDEHGDRIATMTAEVRALRAQLEALEAKKFGVSERKGAATVKAEPRRRGIASETIERVAPEVPRTAYTPSGEPFEPVTRQFSLGVIKRREVGA